MGVTESRRHPLPAEPVAMLASPPPSTLLARRAIRVGFGQGLLVGAVVAVGAWVTAEALPGAVPHNVAWAGVLGAWVWALLGAGLARLLVAMPAVRRWLGDEGLARASFVVPAVGLAVVGPISSQALVATVPLLMGENVDGWIVFALGGTLHVHVAFAIAMGAMAWRISLGRGDVRATLWPAVLLSLIPGAILVFPPALVWITGFVVSGAFAKQARQWFLDDQRAPG